MKDQNFIINTDRLRKSQELKVKVDFEVSGGFVDLEETDVSFEQSVFVQGEVYIVDDELILHLDIKAPAVTLCNICNEEATFQVEVNNFYHAVDLKEVRSPLYDFSGVVREELLLALPRFVECHEGNCPDRELLKPYISRT